MVTTASTATTMTAAVVPAIIATFPELGALEGGDTVSVVLEVETDGVVISGIVEGERPIMMGGVEEICWLVTVVVNTGVGVIGVWMDVSGLVRVLVCVVTTDCMGVDT